MLGTAWFRLVEELRQLKLEGQKIHVHILKTKRLLVNTENQRESCRRQFEMLKRELEDAKSEAENKTKECVALVYERKCLARELENNKEDIRKIRSRVKNEQTSKNVIQRRLAAINAQNLFSRPRNLYELMYLPQGQQPPQF